MSYTQKHLRYLVRQVKITGTFLNGYPMFYVKNIVQNVKLIEFWGKKFDAITFCHLKKLFFLIFPIGCNDKVRVI